VKIFLQEKGEGNKKAGIPDGPGSLDHYCWLPHEEGVQDPGGDDDGKRHFVIRGASFELMEEHPGAEEEIAQCWHGRGIGGEGIKGVG